MSLEALFLRAGSFHLPLTTLLSRIEPRPVSSEVYLQEDVGSTGHKLNSQKCVRLVGRCLLPTRTCKLELATLFEEGRLKSLYSFQMIVSTGLTLPHAFRCPLPAPNIRILAVTSTGRQDAGGSCPELSSHKRACLEVRFI